MATRVGAAPRWPFAARARAKWGFILWMAILAGLVLQGLYSFAWQTADGHHVTGMTDNQPWGLYITGFVFFVGASAGSTVIGLMAHAFGRKDYLPLATRAILVGFLSLTAAVTFIMVDVGRLPRMFALPWAWSNGKSMFLYTSISYYVFGLILLAELYYTVKVTRGSASALDTRLAKWLSILAVPYALALLHAPHGALFAVVKSREFWNNPLLPPHFATVALVSGTALMILVALATGWLRKRELVGKPTLTHMGWMLAVFIMVAGLMDFFDFIVAVYSDRPTGKWAWHFLESHHLGLSVLHIAGYVLALATLLYVLLVRREWLVRGLAAASVLTVFAVAAYRYNLTVVGLGIPLFPFIPERHYAPSGYEFSVAVGIIALIAFTYSVLTRVLPMEEDVGAPGEPVAARRPLFMLLPWKRARIPQQQQEGSA